MEIKDIIRKRREELDLTYEQLGNMIGVGKSTVRKWETGMIENMRRDNIVALAKALNISPITLMGLGTIAENNIKTDLNLTQKETTLLENFNKLNDLGKNKLIEYSNDLIETPKYIEKNNSETDLTTATKEDSLEDMYTTIAAHDDDLTEEEKQNVDSRIMKALKKMKK